MQFYQLHLKYSAFSLAVTNFTHSCHGTRRMSQPKFQRTLMERVINKINIIAKIDVVIQNMYSNIYSRPTNMNSRPTNMNSRPPRLPKMYSRFVLTDVQVSQRLYNLPSLYRMLRVRLPSSTDSFCSPH